ncbi:MAG: hypothetical protein ABIF77_05120 [bacterium]
MSKPIDVLLLLALPASGKSEARAYLASLSPEECREQFGIGHTVQLDDFPYVHLMRRISDELVQRGQPGAYFVSEALPFREARDWGTLIELMNEDYDDMVNLRKPSPASAAEWIFDRFDACRKKVGADPVLGKLPADIRKEVAAAMEPECADLLQKKIDEIPDSLAGKTVVLEFARGGADGSSLPLPAPYGYQYSLSRLAPAILKKANILYIWLTPEESRRKNEHRADPNDPGSILHHGVPLAVMYADYGCDDMKYLLDQSDKPDTVCVEKDGRKYYLPLGRFDNRVDLTTFIRESDPADWPAEDVAALQKGMQAAFTELRSGQTG